MLLFPIASDALAATFEAPSGQKLKKHAVVRTPKPPLFMSHPLSASAIQGQGSSLARLLLLLWLGLFFHTRLLALFNAVALPPPARPCSSYMPVHIIGSVSKSPQVLGITQKRLPPCASQHRGLTCLYMVFLSGAYAPSFARQHFAENVWGLGSLSGALTELLLLNCNLRRLRSSPPPVGQHSTLVLTPSTRRQTRGDQAEHITRRGIRLNPHHNSPALLLADAVGQCEGARANWQLPPHESAASFNCSALKLVVFISQLLFVRRSATPQLVASLRPQGQSSDRSPPQHSSQTASKNN